jgi:hypothetical protein
VDDFGIRYTSQADADHLIATLETAYQVSLDWSGARYCGLTLDLGLHRAHVRHVHAWIH